MAWKQWQYDDPVTINRVIWDGLESEFIQDVLERDWFGPGYYANELERALSKFIGLKNAQLVNSGTSALLLTVKALIEQEIWQPGDLILHPACTFPSPCNVIVQCDMVPVFVDVEEGTYNIDADLVAQAIEKYPQIKGAIIPHLIGNTTDMDALLDALDGRVLIEDCCDTLGTEWDGKQAGTFGKAAAFSFYGSHHITTAGVGGAMLTDNDDLYRLVKSMAFWGREFVDTKDSYYDFTQRYTYETVGYDMQISEIQAAFGLAQMQRLDEGNKGRQKQFEITDNFFNQWGKWLVTPRKYLKANPSWFGYPITVKEDAPFNREDIARHLLKSKIEIRPLFAGNLTKQPAYRKVPYVIASDLTQSDRNMERAFFVPCWGGMTTEQTAYFFNTVEEFMSQW